MNGLAPFRCCFHPYSRPPFPGSLRHGLERSAMSQAGGVSRTPLNEGIVRTLFSQSNLCSPSWQPAHRVSRFNRHPSPADYAEQPKRPATSNPQPNAKGCEARAVTRHRSSGVIQFPSAIALGIVNGAQEKSRTEGAACQWGDRALRKGEEIWTAAASRNCRRRREENQSPTEGRHEANERSSKRKKIAFC